MSSPPVVPSVAVLRQGHFRFTTLFSADRAPRRREVPRVGGGGRLQAHRRRLHCRGARLPPTPRFPPDEPQVTPQALPLPQAAARLLTSLPRLASAAPFLPAGALGEVGRERAGEAAQGAERQGLCSDAAQEQPEPVFLQVGGPSPALLFAESAACGADPSASCASPSLSMLLVATGACP